jgi:hypothetical protein
VISRYPIPSKAIMGVPDMSGEDLRPIAMRAAIIARELAPKLSVQSVSMFMGIWGEGFFGIQWEHPYVWYQEAGIRPFTMRNLAGKVVPMWLDDADGKLREANPKAKTRVTNSGRPQTLVFRRAAAMGARKSVWRQVGGVMTRVSVPQSYPGAPGRIAVNRSQGILRMGDVNPNAANVGQIAPGNVGVRWRHPGLAGGRFIEGGMRLAAQEAGLLIDKVKYLDRTNAEYHEQRSILVHS